MAIFFLCCPSMGQFHQGAVKREYGGENGRANKQADAKPVFASFIQRLNRHHPFFAIDVWAL